jgi:hypothetical protein
LGVELPVGRLGPHDRSAGPVFDTFKYRFTLSSTFPWTTVVSNFDPLDWLANALRPLW